MREWIYGWLVKCGIIASPSLAFKHAMEGKATKRELELVGESAQNLRRMLEEPETTDEIGELLEMQSDLNHPGWDR